MSQKYLLPCSCGQSVLVERRQAGTTVTCACGNPLEVPTIRSFADLTLAEQQEVTPEPSWGLWQGLVFLGIALALPAFAYAGFLWRQVPTLSEERVKEVTMQMEPAMTWRLWKGYEQGMPKNPSNETQYWVHQIQGLWRWINVMLGLGVGGVLLSISGLVLKFSGGKPVSAGGRAARRPAARQPGRQ